MVSQNIAPINNSKTALIAPAIFALERTRSIEATVFSSPEF
jgi:hypothetical protein